MRPYLIGFGLSLLLLTAPPPAHAQSTGDLIQQLIFDARKLTDLKKILDDMQQGYRWIEHGYQAIRDLTKGNFQLHELFLDGLFLVSPVVASDPRVEEVLQTESRILTEYRGALRRWQGGGHFTVMELQTIASSYDRLFRQCSRAVEELELVLTDDALRMSDAERLGTIDRVDRDLQGQWRALQVYDAGIDMQDRQRAKAAADLQSIRQLYGMGQ